LIIWSDFEEPVEFGFANYTGNQLAISLFGLSAVKAVHLLKHLLKGQLLFVPVSFGLPAAFALFLQLSLPRLPALLSQLLGKALAHHMFIDKYVPIQAQLRSVEFHVLFVQIVVLFLLEMVHAIE
jgi:hypothetical protein